MKNYTVTVRVTETKSLFKKQVFEATFFEDPSISAVGSSYDEAINKINKKI